MNKTILSCAAVCVCLSFVLSSCVTQKSSVPGKIKNETVLEIQTVPEEKTTERYYSSIEIPNFPNQAEFSEIIKQTVQKRFAEFDAASEANYQARQDSDAVKKANAQPLHSFYVNWEAGELSDTLISIKLETYAYIGGANGMNYIDTLNWLVPQKKLVQSEDIPELLGLHYTQQQWLEYLSINTRGILETKLNKAKEPSLSEFIAAGTAPEKENFKNITVQGKNITVWFEKYQVAPGSEGIVFATLNTAKLR